MTLASEKASDRQRELSNTLSSSNSDRQRELSNTLSSRNSDRQRELINTLSSRNSDSQRELCNTLSSRNSDRQKKLSNTLSSRNSDRQRELSNTLSSRDSQLPSNRITLQANFIKNVPFLSSTMHVPLTSVSNVKAMSVLDSSRSSLSSGSLKHVFPARGKLPQGSEIFRRVLEEIEREKRKQEGLENLNVNVSEKQNPSRSPKYGKRNLGGLWRKSTNTFFLTSKMFRSHHNVIFGGRDK